MPSSYLRRVEALEAVLGDGVCPPEGCGRCQALVLLSRIRGAPQPACDGRPATIYDGLKVYTGEERRALKAAVEAERERRRALATRIEYGSTAGD